MVVLLAALGAACEQQAPRTFEDFREDAIARDGALARCNQNGVAAAEDVECANARRAAEAAAVAAERARKDELERQSELTLIALRDRQAVAAEAAQRAALEARAAAEAAYDAQWKDPDAPPGPGAAPAGIIAFDVYAAGRSRLPALDGVALAPPSSEVSIASPQWSFDQWSFDGPAIPPPLRLPVDQAVAASQR
jgi:hypothetical protein